VLKSSEGAHLNGLGIFEADEHLCGVGVCAGRLGGNSYLVPPPFPIHTRSLPRENRSFTSVLAYPRP